MSGGLEGVVAAETVLSHTDSARGMVWVRGHDLPDLVANHGFEGTVALLWDGFAGEGLTRAGLTEAFGAARVAAFAGLDRWLDRARGTVVVRGRASGTGVSARHRDAGGAGRGDDGDRPGVVASSKDGRWSRPTRRCPPPPICCGCGTARRPIRRWSPRWTPISP